MPYDLLKHVVMKDEKAKPHCLLQMTSYWYLGSSNIFYWQTGHRNFKHQNAYIFKLRSY